MNIRKKFSSQIILFSMFLAFMLFGMFTGVLFQITKSNEYEQEIVNLKEEIKEIKLEVNKIEKLGTSKDLETSARNRLNMLKPGEIVYVDIKRR